MIPAEESRIPPAALRRRKKLVQQPLRFSIVAFIKGNLRKPHAGGVQKLMVALLSLDCALSLIEGVPRQRQRRERAQDRDHRYSSRPLYLPLALFLFLGRHLLTRLFADFQ